MLYIVAREMAARRNQNFQVNLPYKTYTKVVDSLLTSNGETSNGAFTNGSFAGLLLKNPIELAQYFKKCRPNHLFRWLIQSFQNKDKWSNIKHCLWTRSARKSTKAQEDWECTSSCL